LFLDLPTSAQHPAANRLTRPAPTRLPPARIAATCQMWPALTFRPDLAGK